MRLVAVSPSPCRSPLSPGVPRRVRCGKSAILQTSANATLHQTKMFAQQVGEVYRFHGQWKGKANARWRPDREGLGRVDGDGQRLIEFGERCVCEALTKSQAGPIPKS